MRITTLFLMVCLVFCRQPESTGEASFSCLVNGVAFSSSGSDGMGNAAFKTAKDVITFTLVSMDPKYKGHIPPQFNFIVSPSGTSHFKAGDTNNKYSAKYSEANTADAYDCESGSVTVTSITAGRIQDTFSGVFSGMGKTFTVTNGKFDLPASKYSPSLL